MRCALALALLPVGAVATKCAAGNTHRDSLNNLFCATSATDAASCDGTCCTKADATTANPTCGGVNPTCAFGTYAEKDDAWKKTKTTAKAAQQQIDCCKPTVTCDNTLYSCPAGYKKTTVAADKKAKCPGGPKSCGVVGKCCVVDSTTCGGYKKANAGTPALITCAAGTKDITSDDAGAKTKIAAGKTFINTCCTVEPTCASVTCKTGQVANAGKKTMVLTAANKETTKDLTTCENGTPGSCSFCCVNDKSVNTCGNPNAAIVCPAGSYFPTDGSYDNVVVPTGASENTVCCAPTATCAAAVCPAGYKMKANVATLSCHGNHDACVTSNICCEVDKTTCGGLQSSITCAYGTYDESATFVLSGAKKTAKATMDAWKSKKTTAANKNTDCCTAAAPCAKEAVGTTTPAPAAATTTPAAPIRRYSENAVAVEEHSSQGISNLAMVGAGAVAGMAVLMGVQGLRSKSSSREVLIESDGSCSE